MMGTIAFKSQEDLEQERLEAWRQSVKVSAAAARTAIGRAGHLGAVEALLATEDNWELDLAWEYSTSFARTSPFLKQVAEQLGLTEAELDDLFKVAETLEV